MDTSSTQEYEQAKDFITVTVGSIVYTVDHVYTGNRSIHEVMTEFLEREARNLNT
jgi:ribosomal protein S3AE